jgi:hypothetical protein
LLNTFDNLDLVAHLLLEIQGAKPEPLRKYVPFMLKAIARKERVAISVMKERVLVVVTCGVKQKRLVHLHQLVLERIEALKKDLKHKVYPT